jgi:3-hydroxyisobutyrate dehydrogenase-like beta-hydroxyacid dehydrogenase
VEFGAVAVVTHRAEPKDLELIVGAARDVHAPLPQTAATLQLMHAAVAQGQGLDDYAAIIQAVERSAGLATDLERKA